jgi:hypothetical protein
MAKNFLVDVLVAQLPSVLAYTGALIYALSQLPKVRLPAQLAAAGCAIILGERLVWAFMYDSLMRQRFSSDLPHEKFAEKMESLGFLFGLLYLCGFALIVIAVFVGRAPRPGSSFPPFGDQPRFPPP